MPAFDSGTDFFKLPIVWGTSAIIIIIATFLAVMIACNSNLEWCFNGDGFNYFVSIFKVPIGILALMIPIGAVYAANHRSVISIKQTTLTIEQNKFSNYYKHKEEFAKYIKNNAGDSLFPDQVHRKFYNGINKWTGKANIDLITDRIWTAMSEFITLYGRLESTDPKDTKERLEIMFLLSCHCTTLSQEFNLSRRNKPEKLKYGDVVISMSNFSIFDPLHQFSYDVSLLLSIARFDHDDSELKLWMPAANERVNLPFISFSTDGVNLYITDEDALSKYDFQDLWDRINNIKFRT